MNRISVKSTDMYLNNKLKEIKGYEKEDKGIELEQTKDIINSIENCLDSEKRIELINEWNNLVDRMNQIKKEAQLLDYHFAKVFK